MKMLDNLTRGRVIFGAGPGALPTDAYIMGIDPVEQRRMMEESLEAILALWRSDEPITRETDWFTIREGRLQIRPYSDPHPEWTNADRLHINNAGAAVLSQFIADHVATVLATAPAPAGA